MQKSRRETTTKENIQYALIALGILSLLMLYLLLSRSFITNSKLIEFFGVIALLIVFEFLNLLLHPFLERVTDHSPVLMLLHWFVLLHCLFQFITGLKNGATEKLVERIKNKISKMRKKQLRNLKVVDKQNCIDNSASSRLCGRKNITAEAQRNNLIIIPLTPAALRQTPV